MSLIDTHVHVWDPGHLAYPWLHSDPALNRPVAPTDPRLRAIHVEAGRVPSQAIDEVRWAESLDWPGLVGIVAFAPLEDGDAVGPSLDALDAHPLVVGVRRSLQAEATGFLGESDFRTGLGAAARHGLVFDATVRPEQLIELAEAHRAVPGILIVLDHLGNPPVTSGLSSQAGRSWAEGLRAVAAHPLAAVKISGEAAGSGDLGIPFILTALDAFGPDRALLGSDHPITVSDTPAAYRNWAVTADLGLGLTDAERLAVRELNATRIYGLPTDDSPTTSTVKETLA